MNRLLNIALKLVAACGVGCASVWSGLQIAKHYGYARVEIHLYIVDPNPAAPPVPMPPQEEWPIPQQPTVY